MIARSYIIAVSLLAPLLAPLLAAADVTSLPVGTNPAPVPVAHFPDRLHAVVFRNWNLVEPARIARTVRATEAQINDLAASMGLPPARVIGERFRRQVYITIVRRNWHLLPYDQLLTMLDMSAEELEFGLREDDFLFIKLGSLKPSCEPVEYREPDDATRAATAKIKQWVSDDFDAALSMRGEDRFAFIDELARSPAGSTLPAVRPRSEDGPRFIYSYFGVFGDPLLDSAVDPSPDGLLARLAQMGVRGVWLHVVLRQLAPGGDEFPEFGQDHEKRLARLNQLVRRAEKQGIAIYLYINEPRAQPAAFFQNRGDMAGVRVGDYVTMCTSNERVRKWLSDSLAHVFQNVPGLGGVFTITASENLTNCASHGQHKKCPRCRVRSDAEIIAEVNAAVEEGVHRGSSDARVIAWDWGWSGHRDAPQHIAALPDDVWLMSVSEWAKPIERGGVRTTVGEYSLSAVGPGPRALRHWQLASQRGLNTVAKVQLNTTWELSAVPFLPVLDLVADHLTNLTSAGVDGLMLSWTVGGYPSPNLQLAEMMLGQRKVAKPAALDALAGQRYGDRAAPHARRAWTQFSEAFTQFPLHGQVLYNGPQQLGPANLLFASPTGYRSTMVGFPYDHIDGWRGPYPPDVLASQFERVATGWAGGLAHLHQAAEAADADRRPVAEADVRIARAAYLHFASVANQVRFVLTRNALADPNLPGDQPPRLRAELVRYLDSEISLARQLYELARDDSRIGFEASNQYYYTPLDLVEKVINCRSLREQYAQ